MRRALHPWNTGFSWSDHTGDHATISADQARQFDELGYFVVEDAFDATTLARLEEELERGDRQAKEFLAAAPDGRFGVTGLDTQTVAPHAVTRSEYARQFVTDAVFAGLARDLIGPDVRLYWDQSVFKQPNGAEPVLWHQDNGYTYVEPQAYLTCWVALTDATPENGCIAVMPGVHREGTLAHRSTPVGEECWGDWSRAVEVPVRAGQHRGVHLAHPARDEAQHDERRAQGLHRSIRARRRGRALRRPGGGTAEEDRSSR